MPPNDLERLKNRTDQVTKDQVVLHVSEAEFLDGVAAELPKVFGTAPTARWLACRWEGAWPSWAAMPRKIMAKSS